VHRDFHEDVLGRFLGVFHEHIEVAVLIEHTCIDQFVFEFVPARDWCLPRQLMYGKAAWGYL
jgi:hypothetical protein